MKVKWAAAAHIVDSFRTRLWPVPAIGVAIAIAVGVGLPQLEGALRDWAPAPIADFFFRGGPAEAREVLGTIASSLITVTSLTFSLTVLTLQLASGQYSPRLLRTFARDRLVQFTLALFLATFVYALTVLRTIRDDSTTTDLFVPKMAVTLAYVLTLVSVAALVAFLAHLVREIRVETMMHTVYRDALSMAGVLFEPRDDETDAAVEIPSAPSLAAPVYNTTSGFLVSVDETALLSAAVDADAVVMLDCLPGDWLVAGTPIGCWWRPEAPTDLGGERAAKLGDRVAAAVRTGGERTPVQDAGYGLRQLTDVAVKALSPGINDPTTAIHALGYSSSLLCDLARRKLGPQVLCDDDGAPRVVVNRPTLGQLLDLAVSQPRLYGASDPKVLSRLLFLLREVAWSAVGDQHKSTISDQLARLRRTVSAQGFDGTEREVLDRLGDDVQRALAGKWRPRPRTPS